MQLNSNTIVQLSYDRRASNPTARRLCFDNKDIVIIEPGVFNRYKSLQELHLKGNSITELPQGIFHYLKELRMINLSGNKISSFHPQLFQKNKKLAVIYLDKNEFTELNERELFQNLPELMVLSFSENKIKTFIFECLKGSPKLSHLYFNDNDLSEIEGLENLKKLFPILGKCDIHNNNFSCSYLQRLVESLEKQNISIYELDKSKGILVDSVYGLKCIPDNVYPYSLSEGRELESKVLNTKSKLKQLSDDNTELRIEVNKSKRKIDELEAALAINKQQNKELAEDHKDTKLEMWQVILELQRQQARSDAELETWKVEEYAKQKTFSDNEDIQ